MAQKQAFNNGCIREGEYSHNKLHGNSTFFDKNGKETKEIWINGIKKF